MSERERLGGVSCSNKGPVRHQRPSRAGPRLSAALGLVAPLAGGSGGRRRCRCVSVNSIHPCFLLASLACLQDRGMEHGGGSGFRDRDRGFKVWATAAVLCAPSYLLPSWA